MKPEQDPMTGFRTLELAFSQGFRMSRVPFMKDVYFTKDNAGGADRYTYAVLNNNKVRQTVVLSENEPIDGVPCFCLFYGTHQELRGKGLTVPFIESVIERFKNDLPRRYREFYIETIVDIDNDASLAVAGRIFGEPDHDGQQPGYNKVTRIWQKKFIR